MVFLTSGERGVNGVSNGAARLIREAEAEKAGEVLRLDRMDFLRLPDQRLSDHIDSGAQLLHKILKWQLPSVIYLPHLDEAHPDHQAALPIVRAALAQVSGQRRTAELVFYEVWSPMTCYGWAEDISHFIRQKLRAVRCYESQLKSFRYDRAVRGLNQYRGSLAAGSRYAEVFRYAPTEAT